MYISINELLPYEQHGNNNTRTYNLKEIADYMQEYVYAEKLSTEDLELDYDKPTLYIDSDIENHQDDEPPILAEAFGKQLVALLGIPNSDSRGVYADLAEEFGLEYTSTLSEKIIWTPEFLVPKIGNDEAQYQNKAKAYLSTLKLNLEIIYYLLSTRSPRLRENSKQALITLFSQMDVCATGLDATVTVIKSDLQLGDIKSILNKYRFDLVSDYHAKLRLKYADGSDINQEDEDDAYSIHLLLDMIQYADKNGFKINHEILAVEDVLGSILRLKDRDKHKFLDYLNSNYNLNKFLAVTERKFHKKIRDACRELNIAQNAEGAISFANFGKIEAFALDAFKQCGIVSPAELSIPNNLKSVANNIYDDISSFDVEYDDNVCPANSTQDLETIFVNQSLDSDGFVFRFKVADKCYEITKSREDSYGYVYLADKLKQELAQEISTISFANIKYYLLQQLYDAGLCNYACKTSKVSKDVKIHYARLGDDLHATMLYVEQHGLLSSIELCDKDLLQKLVEKSSDHVLQIILNHCAQNGLLNVINLALEYAATRLDKWRFEFLYNIAAANKSVSVITTLLEHDISLEMAEYKQMLNCAQPLHKVSNPYADFIATVCQWPDRGLILSLITRGKVDFTRMLAVLNKIKDELVIETILDQVDKIFAINPRLFVSYRMDSINMFNIICKLAIENKKDNLYLFCKLANSKLGVYFRNSEFSRLCYPFLLRIAENKAINIIKYILTHLRNKGNFEGLNFDCRYNCGVTPLSMAVNIGDCDAIIRLLAAGADVHVRLFRKNRSVNTVYKLLNKYQHRLPEDMRNLFSNPVEYAASNHNMEVLTDLLAQPRYQRLSLYESTSAPLVWLWSSASPSKRMRGNSMTSPSISV